MTGGEARHGRRNNGLYAAEYAVVGDVDPRIGEHLLDVLGIRGIAAYLQPSSDQHPVTRLTTLPSRPTDRLYVDRREVAAAREFFAIATRDLAPDGTEPAPGGDDPVASGGDPADARPGAPATPAARVSGEFESAWASIVAGYDATADGPAPWPASEDVAARGKDRTAEREAAETTEGRRGAGPASGERLPEIGALADAPLGGGSTTDGSLLDGLDTFGADLPDADDEDDYQPPPPPPLPRFAGITIVGTLGVIAGLAVIADPALLPVDSTSAAMLGGASLLAGGIALIGRLRSGNEDEPDDPDHGAVI